MCMEKIMIEKHLTPMVAVGLKATLMLMTSPLDIPP